MPPFQSNASRSSKFWREGASESTTRACEMRYVARSQKRDDQKKNVEVKVSGTTKRALHSVYCS